MTVQNDLSTLVPKGIGVALACLLGAFYYFSISSPIMGAIAGLLTAFIGFLGLFSSKTPLGRPLNSLFSDRVLGQMHIVVAQGAKLTCLMLIMFVLVIVCIYLEFYLTVYSLISAIVAVIIFSLIAIVFSILNKKLFFLEMLKRAFVFCFAVVTALSLIYFMHNTKKIDEIYSVVKSSTSYDVSMNASVDRGSHIRYWASVYTFNLSLERNLVTGCLNEHAQYCIKIVNFLSAGTTTGINEDLISSLSFFKDRVGNEIAGSHIARWKYKFEKILLNKPRKPWIFHTGPVAIMWEGREYLAMVASSAKVMTMYLFLKLKSMNFFGLFVSIAMLFTPIPLSNMIKKYNMEYDDNWNSDGHHFLMLMGLFGFFIAIYSLSTFIHQV